MTPLQMLVMSFFPGIVVVLNIVLMVSGGSEVPSMMNMMLTFGLTIAVLIHLGIVQMVNDQMLLQQTLMVEAVRQKKSAEALLESYKTQRRLTHEFTNTPMHWLCCFSRAITRAQRPTFPRSQRPLRRIPPL